ncbi:glycosyltransferase [Cyanobacterium aponinum AL20118]|uniref:glycosyltransferase family 2 protein n=1 Tax=Cyanobacterium aponinum TaxID=379064 RepID=UPI00324ED9BA
MLTILSVLLFLLSFIHFCLAVTLMGECLASALNIKKDENFNDKWLHTSVSVLIPAHNEEKVISQTLKTIIPQLKSTDNIIVIADNCTDCTVAVVENMGVKIIERQNDLLKGKGYALDFGVNYLRENPPDVVIFIDADCNVEQNAIAFLVKKTLMSKKPVQALYLMEKPMQPSGKDQISAFAFKVKNLVRPLGLYNLNQPCLLTGTGMAIRWEVLKTTNLASGEIVEDMKLGLDLAIASYPPIFCPSAHITGRLPQKEQAATTQRTRWEHGHLQTAINYVPLLIKESVKQRRFDLFILALDLAIPPLSLFVSFSIALTLISFLSLYYGIFFPFLVNAIASLLIFFGIFIAWVKFAREELTLTTLMKIPLYILWKIPLYFKFLFKRENQWIRTERDDI